MLHSLSGLGSLLLYLVDLAIFLLPGSALAMTIAGRKKLSPIHAVTIIVITGAALGYLSFWTFFGSKLFGRLFSLVCLAASVIALVLAFRRNSGPKALARAIATPFVYVALVGMCYLCWLYLFNNPPQASWGLANIRFFSEFRPGDNVIPLIFGDKIYGRQPVRPFCCGDWLSSDRPPLQAGIYLFWRPLRLVGSASLNYQLLCTGLQCLWICGVWTLLFSLRISSVRMRQILGFLVFSGFLFYNSVFVWPKLLAAALVLFAAAILVDLSGNPRTTERSGVAESGDGATAPCARWRDGRSMTWFEAILLALVLSLAILAHPGSIFSLPAIAIFTLWRRKVPDLRKAAMAVLLMAGLFLPWVAYQKFYDPPGNRLLKMHLAGVYSVDSRSTVQALRDAYRIDAGTIFRLKWDNILRLIGPRPFDGFGFSSMRFAPVFHFDQAALEATRFAQREYIWNAVGVLNIGWLAAALLWFRKKASRPAVQPYSGLLITAAVANLLLWCLIMYGPAQTMTTHGSFADIFLLSIGLSGFLFTLPRVAVISLFALQIFNLFAVWISFVPVQLDDGRSPSLEWPLLIAGLVLTIGLGCHFGKAILAPDS